MDLKMFWQDHPACALAFSGGADSAYLLYSAVQAGADITAYFVKTEFQPQFELEDARRLAEALGARLVVLEQSVLTSRRIADNPPNRCYFCKQRIFSAILSRAAEDGYSVVLDGTNASDDASDRPGMQALQELQVLSPLRLCGLTKPEVRRLSREAGLFTWDKPAYACLATRIPAGTAITAADLSAVEQAEAALSALGFSDFRVRRTADGARLQMPERQLPSVLAQREEILRRLAPLLGTVTLDLQPRPAPSEPRDALRTERVAELCCNLDDMTGEDLAFAMELLLERGALDAWTTPIGMKKSRPAVLLTCLCRCGDAERLTALILQHTSTLGVRRTDSSRVCLERSVRTCGDVRVKTARGPGICREKAEFEDLAAIARREGQPLAEIRRQRGL